MTSFQMSSEVIRTRECSDAGLAIAVTTVKPCVDVVFPMLAFDMSVTVTRTPKPILMIGTVGVRAEVWFRMPFFMFPENGQYSP